MRRRPPYSFALSERAGRAGVAGFLVGRLDDDTYVRAAPAISN